MKKNILLTGMPGSGKTTLIRKLSEVFKEFNPAGFYTSEVIEEGVQTGLLAASLFGDSKIFAHVGLKSKYSVGRLRVDLKGFDVLLDNVFSKDKKTGLYFIDEIARAESLSKKFCKLLTELLNGEKPVIASISDKGTGIISDVKKRSDVKVHHITLDNHDLKLKELTMEIRDLLLE